MSAGACERGLQPLPGCPTYQGVRCTAGRTAAAASAQAAVPASTRVTPPSEGPAVLDGISTVILDCDGVIWRGNETVRNAPEVPPAGCRLPAADAVLRTGGRRLLAVLLAGIAGAGCDAAAGQAAAVRDQQQQQVPPAVRQEVRGAVHRGPSG